MLDSAFDLFVQSRRTLDRARGGLGIGLTLVMAWGSFYLFDTLLRVPLPRGPFGL